MKVCRGGGREGGGGGKCESLWGKGGGRGGGGEGVYIDSCWKVYLSI